MTRNILTVNKGDVLYSDGTMLTNGKWMLPISDAIGMSARDLQTLVKSKTRFSRGSQQDLRIGQDAFIPDFTRAKPCDFDSRHNPGSLLDITIRGGTLELAPMVAGGRAHFFDEKFRALIQSASEIHPDPDGNGAAILVFDNGSRGLLMPVTKVDTDRCKLVLELILAVLDSRSACPTEGSGSGSGKEAGK